MWQVWGSYNFSFNTGWWKWNFIQISAKTKHFFPITLKTQEFPEPWLIRLVFADAVQNNVLTRWVPSLQGPTPASGNPWPQDSNLRRALPGSQHLRSALLSVITEQHEVTLCMRKSPLQAWLRGPQIRFIWQDKITRGQGTAEPGSREIYSVAAQQEKCLLSPKLFFLVFWTKSPFAIKFVSHVTLKMAVILDCFTDVKIIYYRSSFY